MFKAVKYGQRSYLFQAESEGDMNRWANAMSAAATDNTKVRGSVGRAAACGACDPGSIPGPAVALCVCGGMCAREVGSSVGRASRCGAGDPGSIPARGIKLPFYSPEAFCHEV